MKRFMILLMLLAIPWVCPQWDESLLPPECRGTTSINCLPRCGKYPGDRPDIGAYEWFPGITKDKPWGDWNGVPLNYNPLNKIPQSPKNLTVDTQ